MTENKQKLKKCNKCQIPETYETIEFDKNGICNICEESKKKDDIDWGKKKLFLDRIIDENKGKYAYDCIIPFSGGKDSVFQVYYLMKEYKIKPLLVRFNHGFIRKTIQENVIKIFGDMKEQADESQAAQAKEMVVSKGADLENRSEQFNLWERMLLRLVGIDEDLDKLIEQTKPGKEGKTWLGSIISGLLFGGLVGFISGVVFGFGEVLFAWLKLVGRFVKFVGMKFVNSKFMKPIVDPIKAFFKGIGNRIKKIGKGTRSSLIAPIANFFKDIIRQFKAGFSGSKSAVATSKGFAKQNMFAKIGKIFGSISRLGKAILAPIIAFSRDTKAIWLSATKMGKTTNAIIKPLGGLFRVVKLAFLPFMGAAKIAGPIFFKFGRVFGRLFYPLTILMGVIDGVKGFIDGFKNTEGNMFSKIIGGLIGGTKGIINGLIMMPLDMLKNGVAWILSKFGFEGMAEGLKSFSFQEMFSKFVDMFTNTLWAVVDWFKLLFSDPGAALKSLVVGMGNIIMDFYKMILRFILPDPKGGKWYNPLSLIQKVIPDSVYEWAGLDPDTGEKIPDQEEMGPPKPDDPLQPTPETKSTLSRWGENISGWWNKEDEVVDPIVKLKYPNETGTQERSTGPIFSGGNSVKGGDQTIINIVGDTGAGQETSGSLRAVGE